MLLQDAMLAKKPPIARPWLKNTARRYGFAFVSPSRHHNLPLGGRGHLEGVGPREHSTCQSDEARTSHLEREVASVQG